MSDTDELRLVSVADAARAFGRDPSAFRHAKRLGRLRVTRIGTHDFTTMADAADYVASQQRNHFRPRREEAPTR